MDILFKLRSADKLIKDNIESGNNQTLIARNILGNLRTFIELVIVFIYSKEFNEDHYDFNQIKIATSYMRTNSKYNFISKFHLQLQNSVSHYIIDEDSAEHLMLKYCDVLIKIKYLLKRDYNITVLEKIKEFIEVYEETNDSLYIDIYEKLLINKNITINSERKKYYINNCRQIYVKETYFYEYSISMANDFTSKQNSTIVYSLEQIPTNYAINLRFINEKIENGNIIPIKLISDYIVSIRGCEFKNLFYFLKLGTYSPSNEFQSLMNYITETQQTLLDIVDMEEGEYCLVRDNILGNLSPKIFKILDRCRYLLEMNIQGSNVLRYLLYSMRNKIIKGQTNRGYYQSNENLNLKYQSLQFDDFPFASGLCMHSPKLYDIFQCIDSNGREHEFFAREVQSNSDKNNQIYLYENEAVEIKHDSLQQLFNEKIYPGVIERREILKFGNNRYVKGNYTSTYEILLRISELIKDHCESFTKKSAVWLNDKTIEIDCKVKQICLENLFSKSLCGFIYGAAGTGKSTLISYISDMYNDVKQLFLTNTNAALENLKSIVSEMENETECDYYTLSRFVNSPNLDIDDYEIIFIDECSTIPNDLILKILKKNINNKIVFVGDIYQIESISFGNWFYYAKHFISKEFSYELTKVFRSKSSPLMELWTKVRNLDGDIIDYMSKNNYIRSLNDNAFKISNENSIILCLNYEGLYGINNINRILQENNVNPPFYHDINIYKVGDPILFLENNPYHPILHNNLKGKINCIEKEGNKIIFTLRIEKRIDEEVDGKFEVVKKYKNHSFIKIEISDESQDDDSNDKYNAVPFQISYATSIHKSQGLEYDNVNIIFTNRASKNVSHNIFYTAITRAKKNLNVFCEPQIFKEMINSFEKIDYERDMDVFSAQSKFVKSKIC